MTGLLVNLEAGVWQPGSVTCRNLKNIASKCHGKIPRELRIHSAGPYFWYPSYFYEFDGSTSFGTPAHDPCGTNRDYQKKNVMNPGGNLFIR